MRIRIFEKIRLPALLLLAAVMPFSIALTNLIFFPLLGFWVLTGPRAWQSLRWGLPEKGFAVFIIVSVLSSLWGLDPAHSLWELRDDLHFVVYLLLAACLSSRQDSRRVIHVFVAASFLTALFGIVQYGIGVNQNDASGGIFLNLPEFVRSWPRGLVDLLSMINGRVAGTRSHPLTYAECLLLAFGVGLSGVALTAGKRWMLWGGVLWIMGAALLLSLSRGPWITVGLMAIATVLLVPRSRVVLRAGVLALPILGIFAVPAVRARIHTISDTGYFSNVERLHMWKAGASVWKQSPFLGVGPGNVKRATRSFLTPDEAQAGGWGHLHSTYVNFAVERGALGLLAFLGWMGAFAWELRRSYRHENEETSRMYPLAGLLTLAAFLGAGMTETVYSDTEPLMTFYFVLGASMAWVRAKE